MFPCTPAPNVVRGVCRFGKVAENREKVDYHATALRGMLKMPKKFGTGIEYTGYTTPAAESPPLPLIAVCFPPHKDTLRTQPAPLCVRRAVCGKRSTAEKNRKMGGRKKEEKEMKRFSRLVAAMVALALVLTGVVFAETQGTIAERYQDALSRLERYLMNLQDDSVNITTLAEDFQKLEITRAATPSITTRWGLRTRRLITTR